MENKEVRHEISIVYPETWFMVKYMWNYNDLGLCSWVDFQVYRIKSLDEKSADVTCYSEVFASGFVKYDGCTEFSVDRNHMCGFYEIKQFQQLFTDIYQKVSEICKVEFKNLE